VLKDGKQLKAATRGIICEFLKELAGKHPVDFKAILEGLGPIGSVIIESIQ
jgi:hypothetical protein